MTETPRRPLNVMRLISFMTVGGVQSMLLRTLPHFDRERFRLRVCCTSRKGEVGEALEREGIPVDVCPIRGRLNPFALFKLSRWLRAARPDIVHTHMYASNLTGTLAARLAGVPVIISHIHSTHEWRTGGRVIMERFAHRFRSGYITVSEAVREAFLEKTKLACRDRMRVFYNVCKFTEAAPAGRTEERAAALRAELGLAPDERVAGTVTRLVPVKGLDVLLRAARRVVDAAPRTRFVIVGGGREREALTRQAAELGLGERVIFTGERLNVADYYALFDLFVLSSRTEGFSNVILEAMHFGVPVVATAVGGNPEIVREGETGLLAPPENPEALAGAILRSLADRETAHRIVERARKELEKFTVPAYVEQMQNFYEELFFEYKK